MCAQLGKCLGACREAVEGKAEGTPRFNEFWAALLPFSEMTGYGALASVLGRFDGIAVHVNLAVVTCRTRSCPKMMES
jgi:hypothetical protein